MLVMLATPQISNNTTHKNTTGSFKEARPQKALLETEGNTLGSDQVGPWRRPWYALMNLRRGVLRDIGRGVRSLHRWKARHVLFEALKDAGVKCKSISCRVLLFGSGCRRFVPGLLANGF